MADRSDASSWTVPPLPARGDRADVPGAMHGSRLLDQPEHREARDRIAELCSGSDPLAIEIGFDHGMRLLDHARRWPEIRWLGLELRRRRVDAVALHAPPNCAVVRADARTVFATLVPDGRVSWVYALFPTPVRRGARLLFTPSFVADLRRALTSDGQVAVATDVPAMAAWIEAQLHGWPVGVGVPLGPVLSRRERVCLRDGTPVHRIERRVPAAPVLG